MKQLAAISLGIFLVGCGATSKDTGQPSIGGQVTNATAENSPLAALNRFPPRYPRQQAKVFGEGCATVEYVVSQDHQISDIKVVSASHYDFGAAAEKVIPKWDWQSLPAGTLETPLKLQTRFEYCIDDGSGRCAMPRLVAKTQCSGSDVVASVGVVTKA